MVRARVVSILAATALGAALVAGTAGVASARPAGASASPAVVTLTYDASRAPDWTAAITQGVANWNAAEHNVQLVPADSASSADFVYVETNGWPQTTLGPIFPTGRRGEVQLGQEAVNEGYDPTRIAAHETGHIFGLPDDYSGPCSELMSGHGPGTSCTNATPDAAEAAQVDANYASGASVRPQHDTVVVDIWSDRLSANTR